MNLLEVEVSEEVDLSDLQLSFEDLFQVTLSKIPSSKDYENTNFTLLVCDSQTIQRINHLRRGKNKPTDVLSFPGTNEIRSYFSGEIVISIEFAKEQASQLGIPFEEELGRLFVHGVLHNFGYDHETSQEEERKMQELEDLILADFFRS